MGWESRFLLPVPQRAKAKSESIRLSMIGFQHRQDRLICGSEFFLRRSITPPSQQMRIFSLTRRRRLSRGPPGKCRRASIHHTAKTDVARSRASRSIDCGPTFEASTKDAETSKAAAPRSSVLRGLEPRKHREPISQRIGGKRETESGGGGVDKKNASPIDQRSPSRIR